MNTIKVEKLSLIATLKENRKKHKIDYEKAIKDFRAKSKTELAKALKTVKPLAAKIDGKDGNLAVFLQVPSEHLKEYDRAIAMLEMDIDDHVTLDENEYDRYVDDQWIWKQQFAATNSLYAGSAMAIGKKKI